ncbi:F0F1 ATP synthase subunit B [Candidatus Acetothermia bacterium]|nr:F0F1 ATP synthase subunit B [Candidatus Acetothermia bacterium]
MNLFFLLQEAEHAVTCDKTVPPCWGDIITTINWTFVLNIIQFLVLIWVLNKILYAPLINLMKQRQDKVGLSLAKAEQQRKEAQALKEQRQHELAVIGTQARQIVEEARRQGDQIMQQSYQQARAESQKIVEKAKAEAVAEKAQLRRELENEIGVFVSMSASKLLGREVTIKTPRISKS